MATTTQLLCNNFGGIRQKNSVFTGDIITAKDVQNVELYHTGINGGVGIRTMLGNVSINSSLVGNERIINIFETIQNKQKYFLVHTESETEGKLYILGWDFQLTVKKSGLSLTGESNGFDIAQGWSDLFFFTNGVEMFTLEIGAATEVVDMNNLKDREDRDVCGIIAATWAGRLWIFKNNIIWYSAVANIYDFTTADAEWETSAGYIEVVKNITAVHEYLNSLAIFYNDSSELLTVSNGEFSRGEESPGGCSGMRALVFHNTDLFFYDNTKKSVFSFKQIVTGEKILGENVAIEVRDELLKIDAADANKVYALSVFISGRNEIWFNIPNDDANYSTILIYDYEKGEWVKRKSQKINATRVIDNRLYSAADDGNILEEYTSSLFNGSYIGHYYKFSPFNLGAMNTLKVLAFPPRITMDTSDHSKFYVEYRKNYNMQKRPKIRFIKSKLKKTFNWDVGHYDTDQYYPAKNQAYIYKFPTSTFKVLEISIYTTEEKQDFNIRNIEFSKIKVKQV